MKNGITVFVVDDEVTIAFTLAEILRVHGFIVESFTDPLAALEAAVLSVPHLLISDVVMPQMTGVDLAIHMLALCPECKILLFSGQAATVDFLVDARKAGYDFQILQKPVHPQDLLMAIREQHITLMD